jgi:hypothetical protein
MSGNCRRLLAAAVVPAAAEAVVLAGSQESVRWTQ